MKISPKQLQQIIKEETIRLKKRMMLESEKTSILKRLQEINEYGTGMMEDEEIGAPEGDIQIEPQVASEIEKRAQNIATKLSPEQLARVESELSAAGLLGASEDEIKNKIEEMLPMNESTMNEAWDKSKVYNWLVGGGLGASAAGLITTILGNLPTQSLSHYADYTGATVHPGAAVYAGLIALAIGAISTGVGVMKNKELASSQNQMSPEQAAKVIANRKARR